MSYNELDRLSKEETPLSPGNTSVKRYTYDGNGNVISEEQSNGKPGESESYMKTTYQYNSRNLLVKMSNEDNGESYEVVYRYDAAGNQIALVTGNGQSTTTYGYDSQNRLIKQTDPMGQSITHSYDNNGNLIQTTDRNGTVTARTYNNRNLPLSITAVTPEGQQESISYTYAANGAKIKESNGELEIRFQYEDTGLLSKELEPGGIIKQYTYDLDGNRVQYVLSKNGVTEMDIRYQYNKRNLLTSVTENGQEAAAYSYDKNSNLIQVSLGNGIKTDYTYNSANLPASLENKKGGTVLFGERYDYYLNGSQMSKTNHKGETTGYVYDGLGRLVEETGPDYSKTYAFDAFGNRVYMAATGREELEQRYTYDGNNRLLAVESTAGGSSQTAVTQYYYDANGNQIGKTNFAAENPTGQPADIAINSLYSQYELFSYNALGQMTGYQSPEATAIYTYRPDGYRHSKTVEGESTIHIWDGQSISMELGGNGEVLDRYLHANKTVVKSSRFGYYLKNAHGDVAQVAAFNGGITNEYEYDAYGNEWEEQPGDTNPFRYCGEYYDGESGLTYLRARYYDAGTGRFVSEDPIYSGTNWYVYGNSNPVNFIDPTGLIAKNIMKTLAKAYNAKKINSEDVAKTVVAETISNQVLDGGGGGKQPVYTILHNMAQIFAGAAAIKKGFKNIAMEYSIASGKYKTNGDPIYRSIDLSDPILGEIWEIKPKGGDPESQLKDYMNLTGFKRGSALVFEDGYKLTHVKTLTSEYDLYMLLENGIMTSGDMQFLEGSGQIFYSFEIRHKDGRTESISTTGAYNILISQYKPAAIPLIPGLFPLPVPLPGPLPAPLPVPVF